MLAFVFGSARTVVPDDVTHWSIFGDAACERSLEDSGLGGYKHGYAWRATLEPGDIAGEYKLPITLLEYVVIGVNLIMFGDGSAADYAHDIRKGYVKLLSS